MLRGVGRARAPCSARHRGCIAPSVRTVASRRLHAVAAGEEAKASVQSMKDVSFVSLSESVVLSLLCPATHTTTQRYSLKPPTSHTPPAQTIEMLVAGESLTCEQAEAALSVRGFFCRMISHNLRACCALAESAFAA
jgi:hypothetical protein